MGGERMFKSHGARVMEKKGSNFLQEQRTCVGKKGLSTFSG